MRPPGVTSVRGLIKSSHAVGLGPAIISPTQDLVHLHTPTQDAVDLPRMVQVVCRFQAGEFLNRLRSSYLVDTHSYYSGNYRQIYDSELLHVVPLRQNHGLADYSPSMLARTFPLASPVTHRVIAVPGRT